MNAAYTPGPWEVYLTDNSGAHVGTVADSPGHIVTLSEGTDSEIAANARLIAASPAMYEALRSLHNSLAEGSPISHAKRNAMLDVVVAALAAAVQ